MLPGQVGLLIIGIVSVLALAVLGVFSYLAFAKEKQRKEKEARARRRAEWHESMKATADDDLSGSFEGETLQEETPLPEAPVITEESFEMNFEPFAMPESEVQPTVPVVETPAPVVETSASAAPKTPEKPKSTRNDFDFKF